MVGETEPAPIRSLNPAIPAWFEGIVRKLHAKDPARRFQSASDLAELLERCLAHVQQPGRNPLPREVTSLGRQVRAPWSLRKRILWSGTIAALVVGLAVAGSFRFGDGNSPISETGEQRPAAAPEAEMPWDSDLTQKMREIRARGQRLNEELTMETGEMIAPEPSAGVIRLQADQLRQSLASDDSRSFDAIEAEMRRVRERLHELSRSLGHDPQSANLIRKSGD
jgi:hypothetical protein